MSGLTPQAAGTADIGGRFKSACWRTSVPRGSQNGHYGISAPDHSALAPANLITLAHFSVSSAINIPKSAGEPANTVPPSSARRLLSAGSERPALISLLSLSMISAGVFRGAPTPPQALASKPGKKSPTVGMSGSASERVAVVTASARSLPALMYSIDDIMGVKKT